MTGIESLLGRLARVLVRADIPYMIIGGQAVLVHGEPRLTMDIDVTLGVGTDSLKKILKILKANDFYPLAKDCEKFAVDTHVLPVGNSNSLERVDVIFSDTPYERRAVGRAVIKRVGGSEVRFISAEDLIIHKLVAGRARDIEDARGVWARNRSVLDAGYMDGWIKEFAALPGLGSVAELWKELKEVAV